MKTIVVANPKGGSGKSTISMHLCVGLSQQGYRIKAIDTDTPQHTLYHYNKNRTYDENLSQFDCICIENSDQLSQAVLQSQNYYDFLIIDTPGHMNDLFKSAHMIADLLITPLNDSLFDLDVLMKIEQGDMTNNLGFYGNFIWELRKQAALDGKNIKWIVLRNRLSALLTKNKIRINSLLKNLSKKMGFTLNEGLMDRIIYKNSFDKGLTVLDLLSTKLTASEFSAKQEMRNILTDVQNMFHKSF